MRILVATAYAGVVGGVETYLRAVLPALKDRGLTLGLLTAYPEGDLPGIREFCPDVELHVSDGVESAMRFARAFRPDVVFSQDLPDPAVDEALVRTFPMVRFAHNYLGMCVSGTKCHALPGWRPCSRPLGLGCLGLYLPRRCGGWNPITALRSYQDNRARQRTLGRLRAVLVASRHMAEEVVNNGAVSERVTVAPLFPTHGEPDPTPPEPRPWTNRVLFVGRLTALKGWRELLAALPVAGRRLGRSLSLIVAGDGPDRASFEAAVKPSGVNCQFLGWIEPAQVRSEMRRADVLAVPSVWPEPFGLVGIEAGCVGLPAVGFATGGIPDWLVPGVSGESAPGDRPKADRLADAFVRALVDDTHHHRLRVGAWETSRRFTLQAHLAGETAVLRCAAGE